MSSFFFSEFVEQNPANTFSLVLSKHFVDVEPHFITKIVREFFVHSNVR